MTTPLPELLAQHTYLVTQLHPSQTHVSCFTTNSVFVAGEYAAIGWTVIMAPTWLTGSAHARNAVAAKHDELIERGLSYARQMTYNDDKRQAEIKHTLHELCSALAIETRGHEV